MRRLVVAVSLACLPACSLVMAGLYAHNAREDCFDNPAFAAVDLIAASVSGVAIVASGTMDESPGWLAVPAALAVSGIVGIVSVHRCERPPAPVAAPDTRPVPPPSAEPAPIYDPADLPCSTEQRDCPEGMSCVLPNGVSGHCQYDRP